MLKLGKPYKPSTYTARVNWYVAPYSRNQPIHLFQTLEEAQKWAKTQPADIVGEVDMCASLDWFDPKDNPYQAISRTRSFVDHRK